MGLVGEDEEWEKFGPLHDYCTASARCTGDGATGDAKWKGT